jgi:hypothetical protein
VADNHGASVVTVKLSVPEPLFVMFKFADAGFGPGCVVLKLRLLGEIESTGVLVPTTP